jgi:hypothetical protein
MGERFANIKSARNGNRQFCRARLYETLMEDMIVLGPGLIPIYGNVIDVLRIGSASDLNTVTTELLYTVQYFRNEDILKIKGNSGAGSFRQKSEVKS